MQLLIVSYLAGVLTALAPCILPLLPVIVGGSTLEHESNKRWKRPLIITSSLAVSVVLFTFLLKASTSLLGVPTYVWSVISGSIVILLGISTLFPHLWERFTLIIGLSKKSSLLMQKSSSQKKDFFKDVLMGTSLGPVFSSCSPTYALIVAIVLPESLFKGTVYLIAYAVGLASVLLLISFAGKSVVEKLGWLADPSGWFRKVVGALFIIVGIFVLTGLDKDLQAYILEQGWYAPVERIEQRLR